MAASSRQLAKRAPAAPEQEPCVAGAVSEKVLELGDYNLILLAKELQIIQLGRRQQALGRPQEVVGRL